MSETKPTGVDELLDFLDARINRIPGLVPTYDVNLHRDAARCIRQLQAEVARLTDARARDLDAMRAAAVAWLKDYHRQYTSQWKKHRPPFLAEVAYWLEQTGAEVTMGFTRHFAPLVRLAPFCPKCIDAAVDATIEAVGTGQAEPDEPRWPVANATYLGRYTMALPDKTQLHWDLWTRGNGDTTATSELCQLVVWRNATDEVSDGSAIAEARRRAAQLAGQPAVVTYEDGVGVHVAKTQPDSLEYACVTNKDIPSPQNALWMMTASRDRAVAEVAELRQRCEVQSTRIGKLLDENNGVRTRLDDALGGFNQAINERDELRQRCEAADARVESMKQAARNQQSYTAELQSRIADLERRLAEAREKGRINVDVFDAVYRENQMQKRALAGLEKQLADLRRDYATRELHIEDRDAEIERLERQLAEAKQCVGYQSGVEWRNKFREAERQLAAIRAALSEEGRDDAK